MPIPYARTDADAWVAALLRRDWARQPTWALTLAGRVIGIAALRFEPDHAAAILGYGVHRAHWGQGLAGEAAGAVLAAAFEALPQLRRVRAHTDARNAASVRVLEKLGFRHETTLRANQINHGERVDEAVFGLVRPARPAVD